MTFEIQNPIPFPGKLRPQTVYLVFMKSALSFPELKRGSWEGRGKTERVKEGKREGGRGRGSLLREQLQANETAVLPGGVQLGLPFDRGRHATC